MIRRSLLICTFPYGGSVRKEVAQYLIDLALEVSKHPAFGRVQHLPTDTTPVDMARNRALVNAEEAGFDYALMIDSDIHGDIYCQHDEPPSKDHPNAKPFFTSSIDWMLARDEPTVVAAPYMGPPPVENCYVFKYANVESNCPGPNFSVAQYTREEAAGMTGIQKAAALPTGLMLIDMRAVARLSHPRFYYEFTDKRCVEKGTTEDVAFSRDLLVAGIQGWCNWDAWCGHVKTKTVHKPHFVKPDDEVLGEIKKGMNFFKRVRESMEKSDTASVMATDSPPANRIAALAEMGKI